MGPAGDVGNLSLKQMFEGMVQSFKPEKAEGFDTVIQFEITGEGGGKYYVVIKDKRCALFEGEAEEPNATVVVSRADWNAMARGELGGAEAYMSGRMRAYGRMGDLMRLQSVFGQP
ncbi:MAG: SCP2 sterol-binding domain-containing protein [Candidatus Brockarchaeota archaeon]|nr:SCP2 sterol-binding domain-containing protein [Candidatus Brockarchaeota archaeon]